MPTEGWDYKLYRYEPSLAAAVVFIILFTLSSAHHVYKLARTRTFYFIPLVLGAICEAIGYCGRAANSSDKENLPPYMVQVLCILIAPTLFCASIYMVLGRLVRILNAEDKFFIPLRWCTKLFVAGDIISFCLQGAGGGLMGTKKLSTIHMGEKVVIGGVFFQVIVFGIFLFATARLHFAILASPTPTSAAMALNPTKTNWKTLIYCIYASGVLIMTRSIFRAIEFILGNDGYLMQKEGWIYGFDAALMIMAIALFNWCHPSGIVAGRVKKSENNSDEEGGFEMIQEEKKI